MIEIGHGIELGYGVTIGEVNVIDTYFVEEDGTTYFVSETGEYFIEEK